MPPIIGFLVTFLVLLLIGGVCFWLLERYVARQAPAPFGNLIMAVSALIAIILLLWLLLPGGANFRVM